MKTAFLRALAIALFAFTAYAQPSIVLVGGKIFTNDPAHPFVEALAIQGDKIVGAGTEKEVLTLGSTANTRTINLKGLVVIPGINDAHTHPGLHPAGLGLSITPESSSADLAAALLAAVDESSPDVWLIGEIGRPILLDETVHRKRLDALAPNRKVLLHSFTGHGTIVSSRALQELGIAEDVADPPGGRYGRNADGTLNGRVYEYAEYALMRRVVELTTIPGDLVQSLRDFSDEAIRFGITSVQAMPFEHDSAAFRDALQQADLPLRVRHIRVPLSPNLPRPPIVPLGTHGIKWVLDGTPVEKGAAVRVPYPDGGGNGRVNFTDLAPLLKAGNTPGEQLLFHASGDQAIAALLNAMDASGVKWLGRRTRIEHADGLLHDLDAKAKAHGVIAVLNPSHFGARTLFPADHYMRAKSLLQIPLRVAIGSDGPMNPYLNIMFATNRRDVPSEALTREEAVTAYTLGSAFAEMRDDKGVLAPGKLADLAVLSQDIFTCRADQLPNTVSLLTIIGGKIVYEDRLP